MVAKVKQDTSFFYHRCKQ